MKALLFLSLVLTLASCQKEIAERSIEATEVTIPIQNPGFEEDLSFWIVDNPDGYDGSYGFSTTANAHRSGDFGLNFYVPQSYHYDGAPQEAPWTGTIYQVVEGLKDGTYAFRVFADAVGSGMYVFANGSTGEVLQPIRSSKNELNEVVFTVKGGTAKIGFRCISAGGTEPKAPYFHADDSSLHLELR